MSKEEAASLIRRFISGNDIGDYEWDPFENAPVADEEVEVAREVCLFYARKYPAQFDTQYCSSEADKYFLSAAKALENGDFRNLGNLRNICDELMDERMPIDLHEIIDKNLLMNEADSSDKIG